MDNLERIDILRALVKASNAFHQSMKESGYYISYPIGEKTGEILKTEKAFCNNCPLGTLTLRWELKK